MQNLLRDDFTDLPIAVIAGDYTPSGEYHIVPQLADSGRWREVTIHHSYRRVSTSRGNWQVVEENDGSRSIEQTIVHVDHPPMLATGDETWVVQRAQVQVRPLTLGGRRGLGFRYRHAADYYAALLSGSTLQLVRRRYAEEDVLAEAEVAIDPDRAGLLEVTLEDGRATVTYDGGASVVGDLASGGGGGVVLIADHPCRFGEVVVDGSRQEVAAGSVAAEPLVRPYVWKRLKTGEWGTDRNLRVGDINGDGVPELVVARRTDRMGSDNYSTISSVAAFSLEGELLWSFGTPSKNAFATTSDLCFQVHDWDRDGVAEVILCRDSELLVLDGRTGEVQRRMRLPENPEAGDGELFRMLGDSLAFADLTGSGYPDCLLLKDRYKNIWAYDKDLRLLWHWAGKTGHYPYPKDIDGDGRDEVMIGHALLDDDGTELWHTPYEDHSDNVLLMNLDDGSGALVQRSIIAGSDAGLITLDADGTEVSRFHIGHAQSMCIANLIPERSGLEYMCNTFWGRVGVNAVFSESGELLLDFEPMPYASLLQLVNWVPSDGSDAPADLAMLSTHPRQGGLIDGHGVRQVMFPDDGHPVLCAAVYDLDGDGIDEVLTWDEDEIWIYKADVHGREPGNYPVRNPWFNESNYRTQVSLPPQEADRR